MKGDELRLPVSRILGSVNAMDSDNHHREASNPRRMAILSHSLGNSALRFDGKNITCTSEHYGSFSIPLVDVAVIGEFTTANGPYVDDWFLVFVPRSGGKWFEASMYAEGCEELREQLSTSLGCSIHSSLCATTDFASRIIWPLSLADRPLFTISPIGGSGFLRRLKLFVTPEVSCSLSPDALSAIDRK